MFKFLVVLVLFLTGCATPYIPQIKGDCVDRAVVIRQNLREQEYEAEIILGLRGKEGHAWVEYKDKKTGEWIRIENY